MFAHRYAEHASVDGVLLVTTRLSASARIAAEPTMCGKPVRVAHLPTSFL